MPIYEFQCERCKAVFEKLVLGRDDANLNCPECGSAETLKLVSRVGSVGESCSIDSSEGYS